MIRSNPLTLYLPACVFEYLSLGLLISGCASLPTQSPLADEIVRYNWEGDIPQSMPDGDPKQNLNHVNPEHLVQNMKYKG